MNENINLCEILKDCPYGTKFYSSTHGTVTLIEVRDNKITVLDYRNHPIDYSKDGRYCPHIYGKGECTIFPSKEQRDWTKFKCSNTKFDPSTLSPFDKVLARDTNDDRWIITHFGYIKYNVDETWIFGFSVTNGAVVRYCIPYNEETKHLLGTKEEEPPKYKWWE